MTESNRDRILSRRRFLKQAGGAAVLAAVAPVLAGSRVAPAYAAAEGSPQFSIGVLVPQSRIAPQFGAQLLGGLRLALAQGGGQVAGRPVQLHAAPAEVGPGAMLRQARALLAARPIDLLIGGVSWQAAAPLGALLAERGTPMIVADMGANVARPERTRAFILRNSLNHWQSQVALGQWAAANLGRRALIASSFYDSGYDTLLAFRRGFESTGGTAGHAYVSHLPAGGDMGELIAAIRAERPDLVYAAYAGRPAADFMRAYAAAGFAGSIPLLGSSMLASDALLAEQGAAAGDLISAFSWARGIDVPAHRAFVADFAAATGRPADAFAALGFDTGRMLLAATKGLHAGSGSSTMLRDALAEAQYIGARGPVAMRAGALDAAGPLYLRHVRHWGNQLDQVAFRLLGTAEMFDHTQLGLAEDPKTGWSNAYLCV